MLQFMREHVELACGRRRDASLAKELAALLNAMENGAKKSAKKWMKSWQDWRVDVREKASRLGRDGNNRSLTALEEKLMTFLLEVASHNAEYIYSTLQDEGVNVTSSEHNYSHLTESSLPPKPSGLESRSSFPEISKIQPSQQVFPSFTELSEIIVLPTSMELESITPSSSSSQQQISIISDTHLLQPKTSELGATRTSSPGPSGLQASQKINSQLGETSQFPAPSRIKLKRRSTSPKSCVVGCSRTPEDPLDNPEGSPPSSADSETSEVDLEEHEPRKQFKRKREESRTGDDATKPNVPPKKYSRRKPVISDALPLMAMQIRLQKRQVEQQAREIEQRDRLITLQTRQIQLQTQRLKETNRNEQNLKRIAENFDNLVRLLTKKLS